jgi:hypothetical protein
MVPKIISVESYCKWACKRNYVNKVICCEKRYQLRRAKRRHYGTKLNGGICILKQI